MLDLLSLTLLHEYNLKIKFYLVNDFSFLVKKLQMCDSMIYGTAATNKHQLTGDFCTVGGILGHTLKGIGISLGISTNLEAVIAQYVDVRLERKKSVLETYHRRCSPKKVSQPK